MTYPRNAPPAGADAERAAFLRDLRALRDQAGLRPQELAARAHYPEETLQVAESGPALPSLPVLEAYVRACGARPAEWEDRWRRLMQEPASSLALPTRAPTAGRTQARATAFSSGPPGSAEQAAIGSGLARVAASLNPGTSGTETSSWFSRPDRAASDPAAGAPAAAAPAPPPAAAGPPVAGPPVSMPAAPAPATDPRLDWPGTGQENAWPPARHDPGRAGTGQDSGWRPAERDMPWHPGEQHSPWRSADRETTWRPMAGETSWPATAGEAPGGGQPPGLAGPPPAAQPSPFPPVAAPDDAAAVPAAAAPQDRAPGRKPAAPLGTPAAPAASRKTARRPAAMAVLSVVAILVVAALLWLALAS